MPLLARCRSVLVIDYQLPRRVSSGATEVNRTLIWVVSMGTHQCNDSIVHAQCLDQYFPLLQLRSTC